MKHSWPIITLKTVDSTNNYANLLIADNVNINECAITALFQTEGRGQKSNIWISEEGQNLTFSLLLNTKYLKAENQFALSQSISLGIIDFLHRYNIDAEIKWPNDILIKKKKIAGILIENSIQGAFLFFSVVGVGININQTIYDSIGFEATSMKLETKKDFKCDELLNDLLDCLQYRIELLKQQDFILLHKEYLKNLFHFQAWSLFIKNGQTIKAKIIDVSNFGELVILSAEDKIEKYMFQEIKIIV